MSSTTAAVPSNSRSGGVSYAGKPRTRPTVSLEDQRSRLYKSLLDQINDSSLLNALKMCDRILRIKSDDHLAIQTKIQLLITLERYAAALTALPDGDAFRNERVYCLYKLGREEAATETLGVEGNTAQEDRVGALLSAQLNYRQEKYEVSRDLYEDLLAETDIDSPEYEDLQTNLEACNIRLQFAASLPSLLASTSIPSIDQLESTPIGPLVHQRYKSSLLNARPSTSSPSRSLNSTGIRSKKIPTRRMPKRFDATRVPELDPERWTNKRLRAGYAEEKEKEKEKERLRSRSDNKFTQGSTEPSVAARSGGGGGGTSSSKKKKQKGKK